MTTTPLTEATVTVEQVAKMIDHALLRPELTVTDIRQGCELAAKYQVISVCVRPSDVPLAVEQLAGTGVLVCTVIGFPHGSIATEIKAAETALAVRQGAAEADMVLNIGWLRSGELERVEADIRAVVEAAGSVPVKVILENAYLTDEQKVACCQAAERAGAAFVKTSTGFAPTGATLADVVLMRAAVSPHIEIKASGGVKTLDQLLELANAGVTRFGASGTADILDELARRRETAAAPS
ncbi:MAG TPA: deoxyribose-phosphate aldolase [Pseudonocardia sp.]|nr:deoxyribose-phosphate aldolase [Pseudonocardia sp.]